MPTVSRLGQMPLSSPPSAPAATSRSSRTSSSGVSTSADALSAPAPLGAVDVAGLAARAPSRAVPTTFAPKLSFERLGELENGLLELVSSLFKEGKTLDSAGAKLAGILGELEPEIAAVSAARSLVQGAMKKERETFTWWQRNINEPRTYDARQRVDGAMRRWLEQAKSIRGGARIALRVLHTSQGTKTPANWGSEQNATIREIEGARNGPGWSKEIADLAKLQEELRSEKLSHRAEAGHRDADVDAYDDMTWFWQRSKILDFLTLGASTKGELYRLGTAQSARADAVATDFESLFAVGEDRLHGALNMLLKTEDPSGYGKTRAEFDVVKPAHDSLRAVENQAVIVLSRLDQVESAISYRDMIALQRPSRTTTEYDSESGQTKTVDNPAYSRWQWQMSSAESSVSSAKNRASTEVQALNGRIRVLGENLERTDVRHALSGVVNDLSTWNNWIGIFGGANQWSTFSNWFYDRSQVSNVEANVRSLQAELRPVDRAITPHYERLRDRVWNQIAARRQDMLQHGR